MAGVEDLEGAVVAGRQESAGLRERLQPGEKGGLLLQVVGMVGAVEHAPDEAVLGQCVAEGPPPVSAPVLVRAVADVAVAAVDALTQEFGGGLAPDRAGVAFHEGEAGRPPFESAARDVHHDDGDARVGQDGQRVVRLGDADDGAPSKLG